MMLPLTSASITVEFQGKDPEIADQLLTSRFGFDIGGERGEDGLDMMADEESNGTSQ